MNPRLKQTIAALGLLGLAITVSLIIVNWDPEKKKDVENVGLELSSEIVSTDPKVSATNFIMGNGNIGDVKQINEDYFSELQPETNGDRRQEAYDKIKDAIIPDSPLLSERIQEVIKNDTVEFMNFYEISDLKVGNPSDPYPLVISHDTLGNIQYEAVDVLVDFTSFFHGFYWPTDTDGEPVITHKRSSDSFQDVKITLVKSGDLWFIYDVEDSEYLLNARMATWHGRGKNDVSTDMLVVKEYEMNYETSE